MKQQPRLPVLSVSNDSGEHWRVLDMVVMIALF